METRYYFIFTAAIILLQLLIYIFNKTLIWCLNKPLSQRQDERSLLPAFAS